MKLFNKIMQRIRQAEFYTGSDLLIISKAQERQLYLEGSIPKSTDIEDAFDVEVLVVDGLKNFKLLKEV